MTAATNSSACSIEDSSGAAAAAGAVGLSVEGECAEELCKQDLTFYPHMPIGKVWIYRLLFTFL